MKRVAEESVRDELYGVVAPYLLRTGLISVVTSVLVLAPSLYMLEVYDRVLASRSFMTLLMLTVLVVGAYVVLELLEGVRGMHMHEGGMAFDGAFRNRVFSALFEARLCNSPAGTIVPLGDLRVIRDLLPSQVFLALFDAPLALLILVFLLFIHPVIAFFAVGGLLLQGVIAYANKRSNSEDLHEASLQAGAAQRYADGAVRNAQVIESMAMLPGIHQRWHEVQEAFLSRQAVASDRAASFSVMSKMVQMVTASSLLGVGAWLALHGYVSGGMVIVGSILGSRLIAPLVQIVTGWQSLNNGREALRRIVALLAGFPEKEPAMPLPAPSGTLSVEGLVAGVPGRSVPLIKGAGFTVPAGHSLGVVGATAAGKSTLLRILVGVRPFLQGSVRLDGVDVHSWNKEELGPHIGYLPQDIELFEGSLAENVARFGDVDYAKVAEACRRVGLDALIDKLPEGFDTQIGPDGQFLSGGARQRIGIARAIYGAPSFVALDEPDSSLDSEGEVYLHRLIEQLKQEGVTVVIVSQRKKIIEKLDQILVIERGMTKLVSLQNTDPAETTSQAPLSCQPGLSGSENGGSK